MEEIEFERQVFESDFLLLDGVFMDFPNLSLADALLVAYSRKHKCKILTEDRALRSLKGDKKPPLAV
jgi:predicted nucleic acid-binding protein